MSDNYSVLAIVFNGEQIQHYADSEDVRFTACDLPLADADWEVSPVGAKGLCWRCVSEWMRKDEANNMQEVLDAAIRWRFDTRNGALRSALIDAVDSYRKWMQDVGRD